MWALTKKHRPPVLCVFGGDDLFRAAGPGYDRLRPVDMMLYEPPASDDDGEPVLTRGLGWRRGGSPLAFFLGPLPALPDVVERAAVRELYAAALEDARRAAAGVK
jgi:hypothetical protein